MLGGVQSEYGAFYWPIWWPGRLLTAKNAAVPRSPNKDHVVETERSECG